MTEYVGSGAEVEAALLHDAAERERRAQYAVIEILFQIHDICIETLLNFTMTAAGYHRHDRGPWRKKRGIKMTDNELADALTVPEPTAPEQETIRDVIARASNGDSDTVPILREFIGTRPGAAMALGGDLWWEAMILQIRNYAGRNIAVREAAFARINELRNELRADNPEPRGLERFLIENVLTTWFHLYRVEMDYANQEKPTLGGDLYYERILNAAQQRYLASMKELARLRKRSLPPVQINVAREQVNVAGNVNATEAPPG